MSIKTLALVAAVIAGTIGFSGRADAQVVVYPSVGSYSPGVVGASFYTPSLGIGIGSGYYGSPYSSGYYSNPYTTGYYNGYYGSGYGNGYYNGYYGSPYYGGYYTGYGYRGRRGWRW